MDQLDLPTGEAGIDRFEDALEGIADGPRFLGLPLGPRRLRRLRLEGHFRTGPLLLFGPPGALGSEIHHRDAHQSRNESQGGYHPGQDGYPVPSNEFPKPIAGAWRPRLDGLVLQVTLDIRGKLRRRGVSPRAISLQGFHDDPVEIASQEASEGRRIVPESTRQGGGLLAQGAGPLARFGWVLISYPAADFDEVLVPGTLRFERECPGKKLVQDHS